MLKAIETNGPGGRNTFAGMYTGLNVEAEVRAIAEHLDHIADLVEAGASDIPSPHNDASITLAAEYSAADASHDIRAGNYDVATDDPIHALMYAAARLAAAGIAERSRG